MKKILVVNVNWMGDVIFSVPVFKALKKVYPDARLASLAVPRVKEILECSPYVDEIIIYDEEGADRSPLAKLNLISRLRREKFDIAFLLHRSLTRALLVYLAGIPERVGYDTKGRGFLLTHKSTPKTGLMHRSDHYLQVIESYGIKVEDRSCDLTVSTENQNEINRLLSDEGISPDDFLVVIHFAGNWDLKRWPKEYFARLIGRLIKEKNLKVALSGGPQETGLAKEIVNLSGVEPIVLTGATSLKLLAALLKRANFVVSGDSGPLHLASSVGTRGVALFGPTRPEVTAPRGPGVFTLLQKDVGCNREPCYDLDCANNVCMKVLQVDEVMNEIQKFRN